MVYRIRHGILPFFLILIISLFSACTLITGSDAESTLSFVIDGDIVHQLASRSTTTESSLMTISISLCGDYIQTKSASISSNGGTEISFTDIPVGASIYVEAYVYDENNEPIYTGTSSNVTIVKGENQIPLILTEYSGEESFDGVIIYVSSSGSSSGDGSRSNPYNSIASAASSMDDASEDYMICIIDSLSGTQYISSSIIQANSITLAGLTGDSSNTINGNSNGTTLTISTTVPVTIKKLTIKGGNQSSGKGGGISMGSGTTVKLASGTVITGNVASYGGGVYNDGGTLFMYGSAVIGDSSATSSASCTDYGNKATTYGGGIYNNSGTIYLGYSDAATPTALTGGVLYNYSATNGGGISTSYDGPSTIYIASGSLSYNKSTSSGGAFFIYYNTTAAMSGGSISANSANYGGGVYVSGSSSAVFTKTGGSISGNSATTGSSLYGASGSSVSVTGAALTTVTDDSGEVSYSYSNDGI